MFKKLVKNIISFRISYFIEMFTNSCLIARPVCPTYCFHSVKQFMSEHK